MGSAKQLLNKMSNNKNSELVIVQNFIDGQFEGSDSYLDSFEPGNGRIWAKIPDSDEAVVDKAVKAAKKAFKGWKNLSVGKRADYLSRAADVLETDLEKFAIAESRDQGKPVNLAKRMDIPRAVLNLRAFASGHAHLLETSNNQLSDTGVINYTSRSPVGVAGLIAPWNLPLYLLTFKIVPALMAGCTVVCKPSEMTTVTAWMLCKIFQDVGLPNGVLNLVCGYGHKAGEAIVQHPDVKVLSFTGSTLVGRHIAQVAAPMMKRPSLELGGKNPALVFEDANMEQAVATLIRASFLNQGEICLCTSRIYVHENIFDTFIKKFVEGTKKLKVGDPRDPNTFMGALNSKPHLEKVEKYGRLAKEEGGTIHCGFGLTQINVASDLQNGYWFPPTVVTGLTNNSRCMKEEIFGPIVCIDTFKTEEEAIEKANDVEYGLCASVWSENVGVIHRVAEALEVGTVWENCWLIRDLNMPFGGCKQSGTGREGIRHSLESYTDEKTICIKVK